MLSRGLCDDRSSSPAGARLVGNAIMVDARMSASFDRSWTFPGARDAANVRSTWIRKVARSSRASIKAELGPSSSSRPTVNDRALHSRARAQALERSLSLNFRRQAYRKLARSITAGFAICSGMFGPNPQPLTTNSTSSPRAGLRSGRIANQSDPILGRLFAGVHASMAKARESLDTSFSNSSRTTLGPKSRE